MTPRSRAVNLSERFPRGLWTNMFVFRIFIMFLKIVFMSFLSSRTLMKIC